MPRNTKRTHLKTDTLKNGHTKKGVSLIIVIFAMMVFAVLGWTLAVMQSGDFEANLRSLDSEQALSLAEAGGQWAFTKLKENFDCGSFDPTGTPSGVLHTFDFGQYRLRCTCDASGNPPQCNNASRLIITSTGYIPSEASPRAQRQIRAEVNQGAFSRAATIKNLFSWYAMHPGSGIDGDLGAGHFDGDNILPYDVAGVDYGPGLPPPPGERALTSADLPPIDMAYFRSKAPDLPDSNPLDRRRNYSAIAVVLNASNGTTLRTNSELFTTAMVGEAVRVVGDAAYQWPNENAWVVITGVTNARRATIQAKPSAGLTAANAMNQWRNKMVRVAKRFRSNNNNENLWYIEGSDIIIDVRNAAQDGPNQQANFSKTSLVAERDILVSGSRGLAMQTFVEPSTNETYPNLATENGNIYSNFTPEGVTEAQRANNRKFDGLIYTRGGNINFNYINGVAMMGNNVTLDGLINLVYDARYVDTEGFLGSISSLSWQEE